MHKAPINRPLMLAVLFFALPVRGMDGQEHLYKVVEKQRNLTYALGAVIDYAIHHPGEAYEDDIHAKLVVAKNDANTFCETFYQASQKLYQRVAGSYTLLAFALADSSSKKIFPAQSPKNFVHDMIALQTLNNTLWSLVIKDEDTLTIFDRLNTGPPPKESLVLRNMALACAREAAAKLNEPFWVYMCDWYAEYIDERLERATIWRRKKLKNIDEAAFFLNNPLRSAILMTTIETMFKVPVLGKFCTRFKSIAWIDRKLKAGTPKSHDVAQGRKHLAQMKPLYRSALVNGMTLLSKCRPCFELGAKLYEEPLRWTVKGLRWCAAGLRARSGPSCDEDHDRRMLAKISQNMSAHHQPTGSEWYRTQLFPALQNVTFWDNLEPLIEQRWKQLNKKLATTMVNDPDLYACLTNPPNQDNQQLLDDFDRITLEHKKRQAKIDEDLHKRLCSASVNEVPGILSQLNRGVVYDQTVISECQELEEIRDLLLKK